MLAHAQVFARDVERGIDWDDQNDRLTTLRHVVPPQAMRVILPPVANEVISMVKLTPGVCVGNRTHLRSAFRYYHSDAMARLSHVKATRAKKSQPLARCRHLQHP